MIAYDSGESKYRTIAVPSIIIADIVYVIDDNLCILNGSSFVINRRAHRAGKFLFSSGVGAANNSDILISNTPSMLAADDDGIVLSLFCSSSNNNFDDCNSSSTEGFVYDCNGV